MPRRRTEALLFFRGLRCAEATARCLFFPCLRQPVAEDANRALVEGGAAAEEVVGDRLLQGVAADLRQVPGFRSRVSAVTTMECATNM